MNLLIALIVPAASIVAIGLVDVRLSMIVEGRHGGGLDWKRVARVASLTFRARAIGATLSVK